VLARSHQPGRRSVKIALTIAALLAALLATTASVTFAQASTNSDRIAGWRSDIAYYLDQMRHQHYVYRSKALPSAMVIAAQQLSANVPRFSDERMLAEFEHLASFAGDGHTYMLPFGAKRVVAHMLPLRLYQFSDGLYVVDALNDSAQKWIGARVLKIGNRSAEDVINAERPTLSVDNRFGYLWVGPPLLSFAGYLEKFAGVTPGASVPLTMRTRMGQVVNVNMPLVTAPPLRGIPKLPPSKVPGAQTPPLYLKNVAQNFWFTPLAGDSVLYAQFNQVQDAPDETLAAFAGRLGATLTTKRPRTLIVDVRHNNGGNLGLLTPLVTTLHNYESSRPDARIYVLMGRNTFSAAQVFLARMNRETNARFAGEPSSSRPNFVGEESMVQLPWSGAIGSISNRYHETIPGDTREWIAPGIRYNPSARDYFANRDPLLEMVLTDARTPR
jgi:hypothetical protein